MSKMTQEEIWAFHTKQRETEKARQEIEDAKRTELIEKFRLLGCFTITQHPDYEQDMAFGIDDIIELLEIQEERAIACAHCGGAI